MKKLIILISAILITSCTNEYKIVKTEVIKGKISAKEYGMAGSKSSYCRVYIQDSKSTRDIVIDWRDNNYFKVNDSVLFVLQQVEKIK